MKHRQIVSLVTAGLMAIAMSHAAWSHHSTAAYDPNKLQSATGVVKKFYWTNPHIFIYLLVPDDKGGTLEYQIEGGTPNINIRQGWKADDIKAGDTITVEYRPARDGSANGQAAIVTLANGQKRYSPGYKAGSSEDTGGASPATAPIPK